MKLIPVIVTVMLIAHVELSFALLDSLIQEGPRTEHPADYVPEPIKVPKYVFKAGHSKGPGKPTGKLPEYVWPLDTHPIDDKISATILEGGMGPCYQSDYCKIPYCCGIVSGTQMLFYLKYNTSVDMNAGVFKGLFSGLGLGNDESSTVIRTDALIGLFYVLPFIAHYDPNACHTSACPQKAGNVYELWLPFKFPTAIVTTLSGRCNFVPEITNSKGQLVLRTGLFATLENPNLIPAVLAVDIPTILGIGTK